MILVVDINNIYYAAKCARLGRVDYVKYTESAESLFGSLRKKIAYTYPHMDVEGPLGSQLVDLGYELRVKRPYEDKNGHFYIDWTVPIIQDVWRLIHESESVLFGSGSTCLEPLIRELKEEGYPVYMYACGIPKVLREITVWKELTNAVTIAK